MQTVSSVHHSPGVTHSMTQTANRATTDPIPDVSNVEPADLRSRLDGGEALQKQAEAAGVETEEGPSTEPSAAPTIGPGTRAGLESIAGSVLIRGPAPPSVGSSGPAAGGIPNGRDAARAIEDLASTMAVETAIVRQSIDDGSLSQLLAQNGVQSSIGMLFNTKL